MDPPGIEPGLPACRADVVPLDHEPLFIRGRPGIEPELRPYQGRVQPQHLQTMFIN